MISKGKYYTQRVFQTALNGPETEQFWYREQRARRRSGSAKPWRLYQYNTTRFFHTVVSIDPSALNYALYDEGASLEDSDLIASVATYPLIIKGYQLAVKKMAEFDMN